MMADGVLGLTESSQNAAPDVVIGARRSNTPMSGNFGAVSALHSCFHRVVSRAARRDEFTQQVKDSLAKRSGFRCSNPACRGGTVGPAAGDHSAVNIGVAAHITAAAPGGPRYDAALTREERRSITNGIWCCQNCGRLIDADDSGHTVDSLRSWKLESEARAASDIAVIAAGSPVVRLQKVLTGHQSYVWDVVVTPDGRVAVSASNDCTLRVWDLASGLPRNVLTGHQSWVCSAAINQAGTVIAAGACDGTVRWWMLGTGEPVASLTASASDAKVAWMPNEQLVVGDSSGTVSVWDIQGLDATLLHSHQPHDAAILKVVTLGAHEIATASADATAKVWDPFSGTVRLTLEGHAGDVNSVAVDALSEVAITGATDHSVGVWSLHDGSCLTRLEGHLDTVWRVALSPKGQMIASGSGDNTVRLWDLTSGACLDELAHPDCVAAVAFSPDGRRLLVGCDDENLYLYEMLSSPPDGPTF